MIYGRSLTFDECSTEITYFQKKKSFSRLSYHTPGEFSYVKDILIIGLCSLCRHTDKSTLIRTCIQSLSREAAFTRLIASRHLLNQNICHAGSIGRNQQCVCLLICWFYSPAKCSEWGESDAHRQTGSLLVNELKYSGTFVFETAVCADCASLKVPEIHWVLVTMETT